MRSPLDQHEHDMLAFVIWSYSHNLNFISRFQRRDCAVSDTAGGEWKLQGVGKIVISTHRLLFRTIRIHNDLHVDPLFTFFIFGLASHSILPLWIKKPDINKMLSDF